MGILFNIVQNTCYVILMQFVDNHLFSQSTRIFIACSGYISLSQLDVQKIFILFYKIIIFVKMHFLHVIDYVNYVISYSFLLCYIVNINFDIFRILNIHSNLIHLYTHQQFLGHNLNTIA